MKIAFSIQGLAQHRSMARISFIAITLLACLLPAICHSQDNSDIDPVLLHKDPNVAPVRFEGEILFYVRGTSVIPAAERAIIISKRIRKAAANPAIHADSVKLIPETDRIQVYADQDFIMNVFPVDAETEGVTLNMMAEIVKVKVNSVIKLYRSERKPEAITSSTWKGVASLLFTILTVIVFAWLFRKIRDGLKNRIHRKAELIEKISFKLVRPDQVIIALSAWYRWLRNIIIAIVIIVGINYTLSLFPWTKSIAAYLLELFLDPLKSAANGFINYLPKLFFLIIIIFLTRFALNLLKLLFNGIQHGAIVMQNFYPEWAMPAYQIIRFLVIVLAVVMAFPYIPFSDTGAFQGISVFLGLLLSLGSSSFVSNIIAGYSLMFRRVFQTGDRIKVNDSIGTVESQTLMVTRLRSVKNEEVVIPNSVLINSTVLNFSKKALNPGVILHTTVGIGYETPWRQVEEMLKIAADRTEGLLKDPPPFVLQRELGDFAITYEINAYCTEPGKMLYYYSKLHQNILDLFNEHGVQIMTPAYEGDPEIPKVVPKEKWNMPPTNQGGETSTTTEKE